ncbi:hypothetical protein M8J76_012025 [Diaphorina citri]|nr:hypothetical protein M8J76_012025 [Diaphorina citri]KAI5734467.1 hypothetical protein M8J77_006833 [Diaphorina citri]
MSNILSLTLTLLLFVSLLPFCHPAWFVANRTKIFYCYASKGDHVPKDLRFCKMAWRVGVNQMISCEQCDYEFCNASGG